MAKESQTIEFKQNWRDEYLQYVSGFANAQGGTLYIGIDDNGNVCGVDNAKALMEKIPNLIMQTTGILAEVNLHTDNGKEYLSVMVKPSFTAYFLPREVLFPFWDHVAGDERHGFARFLV